MVIMTPAAKSVLLVIGNDKRMSYLLRRYAEQSGCQMIFQDSVPANIDNIHNSIIIFCSLEIFKSSAKPGGNPCEERNPDPCLYFYRR